MLGIKNNMVSGYVCLIVERFFYALKSVSLDYLRNTGSLLEEVLI